MITLDNLSDDDKAIALKLILSKKAKDDIELANRKENKHTEDSIRKWLSVDDDVVIALVSFTRKRTLIHARTSRIYERSGLDEYWLPLREASWSEGFASIENSFERSIEGAWILESDKDGIDHVRSNMFDEYRNGWDTVRGKNVVAFFLNEIKCCPFCGDYTVHEYDNGELDSLSQGDFSSESPPKIKPKNSWFSYRRCRDHKSISRVNYLARISGGRYSNGDNRPSLYDMIYPEPVKHSKRYFAERRVKRVSKKRLLTKSEVEFFSMMLGAQKLATLTK